MSVKAKMPEIISVLEFVNETNEDLNSPTTSTFVGKMGACRNVVTQLEEVRAKRTVICCPTFTVE